MSEAPLSGSAPAAERWLRFQFVVIVAAGLAATIVAAAVTSANVEGEGAALAAVARASMVAVPIGVGLYAWHSRSDARFGRMLVGAGFAWFLTTFAESSDELIYSIGRVAGWFVEVGLVWLILAFPSGRLTDRVDRLLLGTAVALVAVLYLPTVLLDASFPDPQPVDVVRFRLPGQCLSGRIRAGLRGRRGGASTGGDDHSPVPGRHHPVGPARGPRHGDHAPDPASRAGGGRDAMRPLRAGARSTQGQPRVAVR